MPSGFDISRIKLEGSSGRQYRRQLERLAAEGKQVDCIETAVDGAIKNLNGDKRSSLRASTIVNPAWYSTRSGN
jgi:hypothetical protein